MRWRLLLILLAIIITGADVALASPPSVIVNAAVSSSSTREKGLHIYQRFVDQAFKKFAHRNVIVIRGMFSSGTGWLRNLLTLNCPAKDVLFMDPTLRGKEAHPYELDADGLYGWKHSYFNAYENDLFTQHESHYLVVISRDAFSWAYSSFKMNALVRNAPSFAAYTRTPASERTPSLPYMLYFYTTARHAGNPLGPELSGDNIFQVRKLVYSNWLSLHQPNKHRIHFMRYETLRESPAEAVMDMLNTLSIPCGSLSSSTSSSPSSSADFKNQDYRVKMKRVTDEKVMDTGPRDEVCTALRHSAGLYESILASLDLEFEANVLGYVYPPSMDEYCADASNVTQRPRRRSLLPPPPRSILSRWRDDGTMYYASLMGAGLAAGLVLTCLMTRWFMIGTASRRRQRQQRVPKFVVGPTGGGRTGEVLREAGSGGGGQYYYRAAYVNTGGKDNI